MKKNAILFSLFIFVFAIFGCFSYFFPTCNINSTYAKSTTQTANTPLNTNVSYMPLYTSINRTTNMYDTGFIGDMSTKYYPSNVSTMKYLGANFYTQTMDFSSLNSNLSSYIGYNFKDIETYNSILSSYYSTFSMSNGLKNQNIYLNIGFYLTGDLVNEITPNYPNCSFYYSFGGATPINIDITSEYVYFNTYSFNLWFDVTNYCLDNGVNYVDFLSNAKISFKMPYNGTPTTSSTTGDIDYAGLVFNLYLADNIGCITDYINYNSAEVITQDYTFNNNYNSLAVFLNYYNNTNNSSYEQGYNAGSTYWSNYWNNYYLANIEDLLDEARNNGYSSGYNVGYSVGADDASALPGAIISFASLPFSILSGFLDFEIFGFNLYTLIFSIITLFIVIWLVKKISK